MDVKEVIESVQDAFEEFKAKQDQRVAELEKKNDQLAVAMRRLPSGPDPEKKELTIEQKAFDGFMRRGPDSLPEVERKSLVQGTDTAGGYLAPIQFDREIIKNLVLISPIRQAARVGAMTSSSILIPKRTSGPTAYWTSETGTRQSTQSAYGQLDIEANEMAAYVDVSAKLLEDSAFDMQAEVSADLAEEFGKLEGAAFINGDGVGKPFGLLSDSDITSIASGSASTIADADGQADGLIDALYDLPAPYRARSTWVLNSTTLATVRKLKDSQDRYIWQPSLMAGQPETILGRPLIEAPDMPDESAGSTPILVGSFMDAYRIYDRVGMTILRDPYTQATSGLVRFHGRRRVGAGVVMAAAMRTITCATS